jgi:hypothetical protein
MDGEDKNLHGLGALPRLRLEEPDFLTVLDRLARTSNDSALFLLNHSVGRAPLDFLIKHDGIIKSNRNVSQKTLNRVQHRRDVADWSGLRLWQELQEFARRSSDVVDPDHDYADALIEALAPYDVPDAKTICDLLIAADETDGDGWRELFLVSLVGERRVHEAIPVVGNKLKIDADRLLDDCAEALIKLKDPLAIRLIREAFPQQTWAYKNHSAGVLGSLKLPESEEAIIALLEVEQDIEIRTELCYDLCRLFSAQGVEIVRQQIHEGYDESLLTLEDELLPVCDVLGIELPEADTWKQERDERERNYALRRMEMKDWDIADSSWEDEEDQPFALPPSDSTTYRRYEAKVGRNDPCPCGSGKKHKKCCGKN